MVCEKCEKKLGKIATPEPWKSKSNYRGTAAAAGPAQGRAVGENKLLTSKKGRFNPYTDEFKKCKICRSKVHQLGSHYCQECSYKKGICAMCGKKMINVKNYKQSSQ